MRILKTRIAKQRTRRIKAALKHHGLSTRHAYAIRYANRWQPYHNYQHCYEVALSAMQNATYAGFAREDVKLALLAGLYMDYRHTADYRVADDVNAKRAAEGATRKMLLHKRGIKGYDRRTVAWLIRSATAGKQPKHPLQRVLRDAEMLANLHEEADLWFEALAKEEGAPFTIESALDFITDEKVLTDWGKIRLDTFRRRHNYAPGPAWNLLEAQPVQLPH